MRFSWRRRRKDVRVIGEHEAYARSYGDRSDEVRVVAAEPQSRSRQKARVTGEQLRAAFERRMRERRGS
jgi:hypothetical protein